MLVGLRRWLRFIGVKSITLNRKGEIRRSDFVLRIVGLNLDPLSVAAGFDLLLIEPELQFAGLARRNELIAYRTDKVGTRSGDPFDLQRLTAGIV